MQAQGSQQVSLLAPRPIPGPAGSARVFAGVAQLVEHLFCKQVVSGSIPLASSSDRLATSSQSVETSEGCPSGQREQAVNLPARAYVGSNPTPSTICHVARASRGRPLGMHSPSRRLRVTVDHLEQLCGSSSMGRASAFQAECRGFEPSSSGLSPAPNVAWVPPPGFRAPAPKRTGIHIRLCGSSSIGRASAFQAECRGFEPLLPLKGSRTAKLAGKVSVFSFSKRTRSASLDAGEAEASTGAERTSVGEHRSTAEAQPPAKIAERPTSRVNASSPAHLAQLVEHVLGKDEVISSNLMVGSNGVQP
jgi:hypothetical protein